MNMLPRIEKLLRDLPAWRPNSGTKSALLFFVLFFLSAVKAQTFLATGRFWAEEANFFYPNIHGRNFISGMCYLYKGHIEVVTNFVIWISTQFPLKLAPLITTYGGYSIQIVPIALLIFRRYELELRFLPLLGWICIYVGLPQSAEVFATATNIQWHLCLLSALVLALPTGGRRSVWSSRLFLMCAGLGATPACALAPVFLWRSIEDKDKERYIQTAIISTSALIQIFLLLTSHGDWREGRGIDAGLWTTILASGAQQILSPAFGFTTGDALAVILKPAAAFDFSRLIFGIAVSAWLIYVYKFSFRTSYVSRYLLAASILQISLGILAGIGDKPSFISAAWGGRYFFVPNCLLYLAIAISISKCKTTLVSWFYLLVVISSITYGSKHFIGGRPWSEAYRECRASTSCTAIDVWPSGLKISIPPTEKKQ